MDNKIFDGKTFEDLTKDIYENQQNKKLPKTKRKYLNPENDKLVGYTRARALGLI